MMNTVSQQVYLARLSEDEEPEVKIEKRLMAVADPEDRDQRNLYQVCVTVVQK